jgi:hypothetical protein
MSRPAHHQSEVITTMDYTAFWNIVPDVALFVLALGMTAFLLVNFGRARTAVIAQPVATPEVTRTQDEALAA